MLSVCILALSKAIHLFFFSPSEICAPTKFSWKRIPKGAPRREWEIGTPAPTTFLSIIRAWLTWRCLVICRFAESFHLSMTQLFRSRTGSAAVLPWLHLLCQQVSQEGGHLPVCGPLQCLDQHFFPHLHYLELYFEYIALFRFSILSWVSLIHSFRKLVYFVQVVDSVAMQSFRIRPC